MKKIITILNLMIPTTAFPVLLLLYSHNNNKNIKVSSVINESIKYLNFSQTSYINFGNIYLEPIWTFNENLKFVYIQKNIVLWNETYVNLKGGNLFKSFKNNYNPVYFYGYKWIDEMKYSTIRKDWATYFLPTIEIKKTINSDVSYTSLEIPKLTNDTLVQKNQNITLANSDFAFGRDNKDVMPPSNVDIYETWDGLKNNFPDNVITWNAKEQINGFPLMYVGYYESYKVSGKHACLTVFKTDSVWGDNKLDADVYNLKKLFKTKIISNNKAEIFSDDKYDKINTYTNDELKFRIYYKTSSPNDNSKLANYSKEFVYKGNSTKESIHINNGIFIPYAIEVLEYNDENTYIQGCYKTL